MENIKKENSKKGISLVALVLIIAIMIVLVSVLAFNANDSINNAKKYTFINEIKKISDAIKIYEVNYNNLPTEDITEDSKNMTKEQILEYTSSSNKTILANEFSLNNEPDDTLFYKIDYTKLQLENLSYGTSKQGQYDFYVISSKTNEIYYLNGVKIGQEKYFGITTKIVDKNVYSKENTIDETSNNYGISISRDKNTWTNNMEITIKYNVLASERLYLKIPNNTYEYEIITSSTEGIISFDLEKLLNNEYLDDDKILVDEISQTAYDNFCIDKNSPRDIFVIKKEYNTGNIIYEKKLDISNFENISPTIDEVVTNINGEYKDISVTVSDNTNNIYQSEIKEVRYEYIEKTKEGNKVLVYNVDNFDVAYMKEKSKVATSETKNTYNFTVPKDIVSICVFVIDNAGNYIKQNNVEI